MEIDDVRLRNDIEANAAFGNLDVDEGRGRTVLTGSEADKQARDRFVERLEAAGLTVRVDAVGNVAGRWVPAGVDDETPPVALGSHLDSVPEGGIFDGPLGVYGALEAVRSIRKSDESLNRPLEVVCFTEEEGGRFGTGTVGSSVAAGEIGVAAATALEDDDGTTLGERLAAIGYDGAARIDPSDWHAWLELHIEQGTHLESSDTDVGIVESITGLTNCTVEIIGEADHAGGTPMGERTDALAAAAAFALDVERAGRDLAADTPTAVATVGRLSVEPGARNIVPGRVSLQLDVRDVSHDVMDRLVERCRASLARLEETRGVETALDRPRDDPPSHMSERCSTALEAAANACGVDAERMDSAAMHDTATVTPLTRTGLVFAPSRNGVSHSPREWTDWDDCATATRVLARAVAELAE